jgi:hypothetical protein
VTEVEALAEIRGLARVGRLAYASHAVRRMSERGVTRRDVQHALTDATACAWQEAYGTWRALGADLREQELVVAVVIEDGLLVVTVF